MEIWRSGYFDKGKLGGKHMNYQGGLSGYKRSKPGEKKEKLWTNIKTSLDCRAEG
jgi:hypothetical protein